jgi:hypothetical protein
VSDDDIEGAALEDGEAGIEGLGAELAAVRAKGGHLVYASEDGQMTMANKGYAVRPLKKSVRLPGVDIVAIKQQQQGNAVNAGYVPYQAEGPYFGSRPAPTGASSQHGGIFEPNYLIG